MEKSAYLQYLFAVDKLILTQKMCLASNQIYEANRECRVYGN